MGSYKTVQVCGEKTSKKPNLFLAKNVPNIFWQVSDWREVGDRGDERHQRLVHREDEDVVEGLPLHRRQQHGQR